MPFSRLTTASQRTALISTSIALMSVLLVCQDANGQLFGQRSLGQPLRPRPGAGSATAAASAGTLQGNERFMRENRSRNDFVGSNQASQRGFVGSEQAIGAGRVPTAAESLPAIADGSRRINRPLPPLGPNDIYYPYLTLELPQSQPRKSQSLLAQRGDLPSLTVDPRLQQRVAANAPNVRIFKNGNTAILVGTVADSRQATRIRLMLSFEPGVYTIEDRLETSDFNETLNEVPPTN